MRVRAIREISFRTSSTSSMMSVVAKGEEVDTVDLSSISCSTSREAFRRMIKRERKTGEDRKGRLVFFLLDGGWRSAHLGSDVARVSPSRSLRCSTR